MKRRVTAALLSLIMAFTLLLPAASAQVDTQVKYDSPRFISNLDPDAISLDSIELDFDPERVQKQRQSRAASAGTRMLGEGLTLERVDSSETSIEPKSYVPQLDSSDPISIIVELQEEPIKVFEADTSQARSLSSSSSGLGSVSSHELKVSLQQTNFKNAAVSRLNADIDRKYSNVFNGFSMTIEADQIDELLTLPGVKAVYPNNIVYATSILNGSGQPESSVPFIGSEAFWDEQVTGKGVKVGVIDTGAANDHPDLAGAIPQAYWGHDLVDNDDTPYETTKDQYEAAKLLDPSLPEYSPVSGLPYWTSHGTHVAGVIAGQGVGNGAAKIKGVAPDAEIFAYRVLGPYGEGTTANVIAAIERAVSDGMDIINLSLGSENNDESSADSVAVNNAVKAGVITVVASGNSGPGKATVTDPGTSELAITVGASKPPQHIAKMQVSGSSDPLLLDLFNSTHGVDTLTSSYELADVGFGDKGDYTGKNVSGKIAFIKRGNLSFFDKADNAIHAGAVAAIIYNDTPAELDGGDLDPVEITIPVLALGGQAGQQLKEQLVIDPSLEVSFEPAIEADTMPGFSSRGPSKPSFDIKPDITAPGFKILSSVPEYEGWYQEANGTSMAAPHIAGAAALLKQHYAHLNQYELKSLLMNNTVKISDRSGTRYSHMDQGAGRVALEKVLEAKAVAMTEETTDRLHGGISEVHYTGSLSFEYAGYGTTDHRKVIVKDIVGEDSVYSVSAKWYDSKSDAIGLSITGNQISVPKHGMETLDVSIHVPKVIDGDYHEGELVLTEASSGHVIQMPIAVYIGEAPLVDEITDLQVIPEIISPNGDGIMDTAVVTLQVNQYIQYLELAVFSPNGMRQGTLAYETGGVEPGVYTTREFDASALQDGIYLVVPIIGDSPAQPTMLTRQAALFLIDTQAPVAVLDQPGIQVNADNGTGMITGKILDDLLIQLLVSDQGFAISDVVSVGAFAINKDIVAQVDGIVGKDGRFQIQVPILPGENTYEVHIYDLAGNGIIQSAFTVSYTLSDFALPFVSKNVAMIGEPFEVDILFAVTDEVYAAKFDLLYSNQLTLDSLTPSPQLTDHQANNNPSETLTVTEAVYEHDPNTSRHEVYLSLNDAKGYSGSGSLALFKFIGTEQGDYPIELANLKLFDANGQEISVNYIPSRTVSVVGLPELSLDRQSLSLKEGQTSKLTVTYKDKLGKVTDVTQDAEYRVADSSIATVNKGSVRALKPGQTTIEIGYGNVTITANVTVTKASSSGGGGNGGGYSGGGSGGGTSPSVPAPKPDQPEGGAVKSPVKAGESATVSLPNGLTVTVPAGAIESAEAAYLQLVPATEESTQSLLSGLKLDASLKTLGTYYDFAVLNQDGEPIEGLIFSKPIEVSIPLSALAAAGLNGEMINLYQIDADGKLTQQIGRVIDGNVIVHIHHVGRYMYMAKQVSFTDVTSEKYAWAINEIGVLASKDIVTGQTENLFAPNKQVTRAEFISLLVRTLELDRTSGAQAQFTDVTAGSWYYDAVQSAVSHGLVSGYADDRFAPEQSITRAEMAVILSRALELLDQNKPSAEQKDDFADADSIQSWAKEAVSRVAALGLMNGRGENRFEAEAHTTRAEAAVVMYRMFTAFTK